MKRLKSAISPKVSLVIGVGLMALAITAFYSIDNPFARVLIGIPLAALSGLFFGLPMVEVIAKPLTILTGSDDYTPDAFAKPEYNIQIADNFLTTRRFDKAHDHALKMISYYPKETDSYVVAFEAIVLGELGEDAMDELDELSKKHLGKTIDRKREVNEDEIAWRSPKVYAAPPMYDGPEVPPIADPDRPV